VRNKLILTGIILGAAAMLPSCSSVGDPDEFSVLKHPPLVVPPDYHLRPPGDSNDVSDAFTPREIAKRALFGDDAG